MSDKKRPCPTSTADSEPATKKVLVTENGPGAAGNNLQQPGVPAKSEYLPVQPTSSIPGYFYKIRDSVTKRGIVIQDGTLKVRSELEIGRDFRALSIHWACHNSNGYLAFLNMVTDRYIVAPNDEKDDLPMISSTELPLYLGEKGYCSVFVTRAQDAREGAYGLSITCRDENGCGGLYPVKISDSDEEKLVVRRQGHAGTKWEFISE